MNTSIRVVATVAAAAAVLATSACSTKSNDGEASETEGVTTSTGVKDGRIQLGMMVDLSGTFAPIGNELSQAAKLYWKQKNDDGGVCNKFPVDLVVKDNAYNVQTTVSLYSELKDSVLAFQNVLGSAPVLAITKSLKADDKLAVLHGQGQETLGHDNILMTGATFDLEAMNGLGYLRDDGEIAKGDTVGHIYLEGSYGEGVLEGVEQFADANDMSVESTQITPTVSDLTPAVGDLKSKDVDALVVSGSPPQLASAATAASAAGLDVPIVGSTPTWTAGLLETPAAKALRDNLYVAFPVASFENKVAAQFRKDYLAAHPGENPSLQIVLEYSEARALDAVLEKACELGDLTPAGVMEARKEISSLDTDGVTPELDLSDSARAATAEQFIARVDDVPGGLRVVDGPYASTEAKEAVK